MKNKNFSAAEKHFQKIIDSRNKVIKRLNNKYDDLLNTKYVLELENEELKAKLEYTEKALTELSKLNNLSPGDIKTLVDKATNINLVCDLITGKVTKQILGGY